MNTTILTVVLGILARLLLPLLLTLLAAWILHRLDRLWLAESLQPASGPDGTLIPLSGLHCWEVYACPPERRDACPAFQQPEQECWNVFRSNGELQEACRNCPLRKQKMALMEKPPRLR